MNVKINKYFLVLLFLILFLGIFNLYTGNSKYVNNLYFNKIEGVFDNFSIIDEILNSEIDNYLKNNYVSKYSIKEIRDNYTNINDYSVKDLRISKFEKDINSNKFSKYIILGDALDDNDEIIDFAKRNKGNYILFTPTFSVLAYNSYLSFPIQYLGEFEGHYIDNHGKTKEMLSFTEKNKNRLSLVELLKYLYL